MPEDTPRGYTFPLYSDPADFPSQIQELAEDIDQDIQDLFDRVALSGNKPAVSVRAQGVNQAVAANTDVTATYAEEMYDNANMFTIGTSNSIVNIVETGIYLAQARVSFASNGNATVNARKITINTTGPLGIVSRRSHLGLQSTGIVVATTVLFYAEAGNQVTVIQRQNSGASLNTTTRQLQVAKVSQL